MQGRIEQEMKIEKNIGSKLVNLPDYVEEWYLYLKAGDRTPATCQDFINKVNLFFNFIKPNRAIEVVPNDITPGLIEKYFVKIQTKIDRSGNRVYTSDSYKQTNWICLNNFCDFLASRNYIPYNYIKNIKKPKNQDLDRINEERILIREEEFQKIIKYAESHKDDNFIKYRDVAMLYLFMTTGMRKEALREINIDDIDLDNRIINIIDKGKKRHQYVLSNGCYNAIIEWLDKREYYIKFFEQALFINYQGFRMSSTAIYRTVKNYSERALGYPISPHKLRAGFVSIMYEKTNNIEFCRRAVGHANVSTTQRYIVTEKDEKQTAANIMDDIL